MSAAALMTSPLEALCAGMESGLQALRAQIELLRMHPDASTPLTGDFVLAMYMQLGSGKAVADVCCELGWRLPSKKGLGFPPRRVDPDDVYAVVRGEPSVIPAPQDRMLALLAKRRVSRGYPS